MELEVGALTGAGHGEKSTARLVQRSGYRDRDAGRHAPARLSCAFPGYARAAHFPGFLGAARRMAEKALTAVIQEAYIQGISTRSVDGLAMGMSGISKKPGEPAVRGRPACEGLPRPAARGRLAVLVDRRDVREGPSSRPHRVGCRQVVAVGVNADGRREVLGMDIGASEAEIFWTAFLRKLAWRGVVCSSSPTPTRGIKAAVAKVLATAGSAAASTSCATPWRMPAGAAGVAVSAFIATASPRTTPSKPKPNGAASPTSSDRVPKLATLMDHAEPDVLAYASFPPSTAPSCTAPIPWSDWNGEIKRRTEVVGIFPMKLPSPGSSGPSCSNRMTRGGPSNAPATSRWKASPPSAIPSSPAHRGETDRSASTRRSSS